MTDSQRDEDAAWLLGRERGDPAPPISEERAARYAQLEALIADLPETPAAPAPGWEGRMLARLGAAVPGPSNDAPASHGGIANRRAAARLRWRTPAGIVAAAALLLIVLAVLYRRPSAPAGPAISFAVTRAVPDHLGQGSGGIVRPLVGDKLVVRAAIAQRGELRVYDDDGVEQARCAVPGSGCAVERSGDGTTLVLTMTVQTDRLLRAFVFSPPLGTPSGGLAADIAAAEHAAIMVNQLELR